MIDILLPTYNGAKFLKPLIDSILNQTYKDIRFIVRDDGSKDSTREIIKSYKSQYPDKFVLVEDNLGNQGTSGCNNILIKHVTSEYFMYCDQDDIWETSKIEESLVEMNRQERKNPGKPILICTDAKCIDENDNVTAPSFYKSQKFQDVTGSYHKMLALNIVQGSTALMNKKVLKVMPFIPKDLFHDWWTAVIVSKYGVVSYIHKPLLRYRQHSSNVVGAYDIGLHYIYCKVKNFKKQIRIYVSMYRQLPFRPSIIKWAFYKTIINLKRI